jgi:hypothetical protein
MIEALALREQHKAFRLCREGDRAQHQGQHDRFESAHANILRRLVCDTDHTAILLHGKNPEMARIIDYSEVQKTMREQGFVSLYHNSGAWGFAEGTTVEVVGWITTDDPTIRESARALTRKVEPSQLASLLQQACTSLKDDAWLMPKSHWHYELHFGNRELLEAILPTIAINPALLRERNDGSVIAFTSCDELSAFVERMLDRLAGSDFLIAWPHAKTLCTIHHHKQLWWQSAQSTQSSPE